MAHEQQGTAIVMRRYGGPDVLRQELVAAPSLQPDEIRIRSIGSAVNHSDLEISAGTWPILTANPFPYTPGLEVVGEVANIDPLDMAALGLGSVTAFEGPQKIGDLKGRRIAATGAAGGVGSATIAIARAQGAEVIGIVSRPEHAEYVRSLGASRTFDAQDAGG